MTVYCGNAFTYKSWRRKQVTQTREVDCVDVGWVPVSCLIPELNNYQP